MSDKPTMITRDWLAVERTKLANERTFLAYFRTFLVFLGTGVTILKLDFFTDLKTFGIILIITSAFVLGMGFWRLKQVRTLIRSYYNED